MPGTGGTDRGGAADGAEVVTASESVDRPRVDDGCTVGAVVVTATGGAATSGVAAFGTDTFASCVAAVPATASLISARSTRRDIAVPVAPAATAQTAVVAAKRVRCLTRLGFNTRNNRLVPSRLRAHVAHLG